MAGRYQIGAAYALTGAGAALFIGVGVAFLVRPGLVAAVDLAMNSPAALTDIRAVYGGLDLAVGLFAAAMIATGRGPMAALLLATAFGGLALGRSAGMVTDGAPQGITWILWATEVAGCGGSALAWRILCRAKAKGQ